VTRALVLALLVACSSSTPATPAPTPGSIDQALARAGTFLDAQQIADGSIRSRTYAALKDGWSLTPLAAMALRMIPDQRDAYARSVGFVATLDATAVGALGYPNYTLAIGALVLGAPENLPAHRATRDGFLAALRARQLPDGGWGYDPRTSNLSTTLLAVGALALSGVKPSDPALVAARGFVERCANPDGGFVFSPDTPDGNKAGPAGGGGFRSYGSMTADGLRALLRLGAAADDPRVLAAVAWLRQRFDPTKNPGDFVPINELRRASSYFYWAWSAAHAMEHVSREDHGWAIALATELLRLQRADGAWANPASEMREDDPIIATSFAVAALALCRGVLSGERPAHAGWN
jgi:hypothetical protein